MILKHIILSDHLQTEANHEGNDNIYRMYV